MMHFGKNCTSSSSCTEHVFVIVSDAAKRT